MRFMVEKRQKFKESINGKMQVKRNEKEKKGSIMWWKKELICDFKLVNIIKVIGCIQQFFVKETISSNYNPAFFVFWF